MPGVAGTEAIDKVRNALVPQALVPETVREPDVNEAEKFTVTEFVPCPAAIEALAGAVQLYVTPLTLVTEYVPEVPAHTAVAAPVIVEGVAGFDKMLSVRAPLVPQLLVAVTEREPEIHEAEKLTVTALVPCPLTIDALAGAVQL